MGAVRIANPQPGQARYTSEARAAEYVKQKVAELLPGNLLYFLPNPNSIRYATAGAGGLPTVRELLRYPVVGDVVKVFQKRTTGARAKPDPARAAAIDRALEHQRKARKQAAALADAARFQLQKKT